MPPRVLGEVRAAALGQSSPAEDYIGKTVRFSAWLRMVNRSGEGYVHIRMRVYYGDGSSELRDSAEPPVTQPEWQRREVLAQIRKGAVSIAVWARYVPSGSAWVASPALEVVEQSAPLPSRNTVPTPTNIDFSQGEIGKEPPGWELWKGARDAGYRAEWQQQNCGRFSTCVQYVAPSVIKDVRAAELEQVFPADPYIGKTVRFSAWLRMMNQSGDGYVHIRMRVYYANGTSDLRDSLDPPVTTSQWQRREVLAEVRKSAESIAIWARYVPSGSAVVASPAFETVEEKVPAPSSFGLATASFPVADAAGKNVRFSGWIKTENVANGYAGLWWRVDGEHGEALAFDNSFARSIDERPATGNRVLRGTMGTNGWQWYSIELPVSPAAKDIVFGLMLTGTGTAWFDSLAVEVNGTPYSNSKFDFDFESPTPKGFDFVGDNRKSGRYRVGLDRTVAMTGRQSLKMQFIGGPAQSDAAPGPR